MIPSDSQRVTECYSENKLVRYQKKTSKVLDQMSFLSEGMGS